MTIEQFCNNLEILLYSDLVPEDAQDNEFFFTLDHDSETYWIKLGLPEAWFDSEDEV